jgi:hypothetical protein
MATNSLNDRSHLEANMQRPRQNIAVGTVLVRRGTEFPLGLQVETTQYCHDWEVIEESDSIDARLRSSGWNLFFIAAAVKSTCLGVGDANLRKGVNRLLKQIRRLDLNSLRVTHIASKDFLGIHYRVLLAHPCHIQQGCFLQAADTRKENISKRALKLTPAHSLAAPSLKVTETN